MSVTYLGTKTLQISELEKADVSFIKITPEIVEKDYVNHHILLADLSGSMSGNLKSLKEKIVTTLDALKQIPNSYVSLIGYSGHSECIRVVNAVKCDDVSFKMSKVYETVESKLEIIGVTVISEPLEDSILICKSLVGIADKHHICLFTDGCLVPMRWSQSVEEEKCLAVAKICANEGIFLNCIGFSQYYDRKFLKKLIDTAGNGALIHIDKISDYSNVILKTIKKVNAEQVSTTAFTLLHSGKFFVLNNSTMVKHSVPVSLIGKENVIAVIGSDNYKLNDDCMVINQRENAKESTVNDFLYSLSRYYLQEDDSDNYEFLVMALGDTALFEATQNCYSFIEKGNAVNKVTEAFENEDKRFVNGRNPIVVSSVNEPLCVLEILQMIMNDKTSTLYWDVNTPYHKITQASKSVEDSISFKRNEAGLLPVSSLDIGSEKLNIGIKVSIPGVVTDSISGLTHGAKIFRAYNLINGGNVNVPFINAFLSPELFEKFNAEGILEVNPTYSIPNVTTIYKINLEGIKTANKRIFKSMSVSELLKSLKDIADFKCRQWAINQAIKKVLGEKTKVEFSDLSIEEIEMRKLLRIDQYGIYTPVSVEKDNDKPFEIYSSIFLTWDVKFSDKDAKAKHTKAIDDLFGVIKVGDTNTYEVLQSMLDKMKIDMRNAELAVNCVRIASALLGKNVFTFDTIVEIDKKATDKILNLNMIVGGKVTVGKKTFEASQDIVEQHRYMQLIKCS